MPKTLIAIFTLLITTSLFSCDAGTKQNEKETPKALQESEISFKSYGRGGYDLTDELYAGLVDKSPELKKLEKELNDFSPKPYNLNGKFNKFNGKSENYYQSAENKTSNMTDSALKKKILAILSTSKTRYATKTEELNSLLKIISKNDGTIGDHHNALKILLTLPLIEKYQTENLPDQKEFLELIRQQEKLIHRIDSLIPGN